MTGFKLVKYISTMAYKIKIVFIIFWFEKTSYCLFECNNFIGFVDIISICRRNGI
jgi:hypothetical protein